MESAFAARIPDDAPADPFDRLRAEIDARYDTMSVQLQKIARFALKDPNSFALSTVVENARHCDVQPSTLVRFAKLFGYHGFSDLQKVFRLRLIEGAPALREHVQRAAADSRADADAEPIAALHALAEASIASIDALRATVRAEDFAAAVELIAGAREVFVLAQRRAFPIAAYLAYGLWRLERRAHLLDFVGGMVRQQVAALGDGDLLIAVSFEPYTPVVVELVTDAHVRGVPVLTITDQPLSPLARHAALSFPVEDAHLLHLRPIAASICLAQALVLALGRRGERPKRQRPRTDTTAPAVAGRSRRR